MSQYLKNRSIYHPDTGKISSWSGVNWGHRWIARKCVEGGICFYVGDMLSQYYVLWKLRRAIEAKKTKRHLDEQLAGASLPPQPSGIKSTFWRDVNADWSSGRSLRFGVFGMFLYSPLRMWWGRSLDRILPFSPRKEGAKMLGRSGLISQDDLPVLYKRLGMEYGVWVPLQINTCFFFSSLLDSRPADTIAKFGMQFGPVYAKTVALWLPVQAICFFMLPGWLWVPVTNAATLLWASLLAYANFKAQQVILKGAILPPLAV